MEMESSLRMVPCKYLAGTISVQYRLRRNPNSHSRKDLTIQDTDQYHNLALTATFIAPKGNGKNRLLDHMLWCFLATGYQTKSAREYVMLLSWISFARKNLKL